MALACGVRWRIGTRRPKTGWTARTDVIHTISYFYDAIGDLLTASDPAASYAYAYNVLGQATTITETVNGLATTVEAFACAGCSTQRCSAIVEGNSRG